MPKCSIISTLLQTKLSTVGFYILCTVAVLCFFNYYGVYDYEFTPDDQIDSLLLKAVNPKLVLNSELPLCEYDLQNSETYYGKTLPLEVDKFVPVDIADGSYSPKHCRPQFSVAVLVTYRNRQSQLNIFLPYMHNFLRKQNIHYKIYLIEQQDEKAWNKGSLYNIGAKLAIAEKFPCLVLHDVDLLPLDAGNLYACLSQPRHLSAALDKFRFVLPYPALAGGALAISAHHYVQLNGFSNEFLDWGGEDDNFAERILANNLKLLRLRRSVSRYAMLAHGRSRRNTAVWAAVAAARARSQDGLASVAYRSLLVRAHRLFTLVAVRF